MSSSEVKSLINIDRLGCQGEDVFFKPEIFSSMFKHLTRLRLYVLLSFILAVADIFP